MDDCDLDWTVALHEAGHAVMKWLRCIPPGAIHVGDDGNGLCEGSGMAFRPEDVLLVKLAGIVVESDYGLSPVDLGQSFTADLTEARLMLGLHQELRLRLPDDLVSEPLKVGFYSVEEALQKWFDRTCSELLPYCDVVEHVAQEAVSGYLSAAELHAILEKYELENENNG
jgi:hypothetical protein